MIKKILNSVFHKNHSRTKFIPKAVDVHVTSKCNSECKFCSFWKYDYADPDYILIKKFLIGVSKITAIGTNLNIIGGEPTLRNDLDKILLTSRKLGFKPILTSNGFRMASKNYAERIVSTGIEKIVFSIEGFKETNDRLRGIGRYKKTIKALRNVREINKEINIVIQIVVCKENIDELPDFIFWVKKTKIADDINMQALTQDFTESYFPRKQWWKNNSLWPTDFRNLDIKLNEIINIKLKGGITIGNSVEQLEFWKVYFRNPEQFEKKNKCNVGDFHIQMDSSGAIKICPYLDPIGHIKNDTPDSVFFSKSARNMRESIYKCEETCNFQLNCRFNELRINKNLYKKREIRVTR